MKRPDIKTAKNVIPMIYAYTTPEVKRHDGWTKIGYTEQEVEKRIKQQTHTADISFNLEWKGNAVFDDGSGETFTDKDFHAYLRKSGIEQEEGKNNEWFHVSGSQSKAMFNDYRSDRGIVKATEQIIPYNLRLEQKEAVELTKKYHDAHPQGEFLWNAKPRFGKTLTVYDFMKEIKAQSVLIVTNRPAIANSWYEDYTRFIGKAAGYFFVSNVDAIKDRPQVISYETYAEDKKSREKVGYDGVKMGIIDFVSLQDLKGSIYFGGNYNKLQEIGKINWDLLVIDEAHEGVDTYKTDVAFERIKRKFTLHLSGTPFKALANNKFEEDAIFNYTYADEQRQKRDWDESSETENPYANLPKLNMYTYQMSEIIKDELSQGVEINGETEEYAFDLNEFFATNNGRFIHDSSVDKFLDAMTLQTRFPFSTPELRDELKHTFWFLDRVDSAKALAKKLESHPVFKDYAVVIAAGNGRSFDEEALEESENMKSYDKVVKAISENDKTITLSVGQLTTGITIPEWTAVLMLCNKKSPSLYMQAAFRAQNPCLFKKGTKFKRKENAYVFDFDPARTLMIYEEFANDLSANTAAGRGDMDARKDNIKELLNFFPVIGEDSEGELIELDAEKVLTIPRKIKSVEVVRRGFMSNFLFQNINNIFSAPKEVVDIIQQFEAIDEPKSRVNLSEEVKRDLSLDENGEVSLTEGYVIGKAAEIFGDKVYDVHATINDVIFEVQAENKDPQTGLAERLKEIAKRTIVDDVVGTINDKYENDVKTSDKRQIENSLLHEAERVVDREVANHNIEKNVIEQERKEALQDRHNSGRSSEEINEEFDKKQQENEDRFKDELNNVFNQLREESEKKATETVEKRINERQRDTIEDGVRDHLRGFSRTIPSFLMAYGDDTVTLATFDNVIPDKVFLEVTSITLDQFRFLRDGGPYTDSETGEEKRFEGQLFNPVVFDDSVKEFLALKKRLADYFDEKSVEDIFDYIPPQKTNQIFTPKDMVKKMVDMLEQENPGCFDMPDKTFIDLYMKSGLYIAEIVKRLYQSEEMKAEFPDEKERLRHIFEKQVYGLAPTEIIYRIATSYILGFADNTEDLKHNFRQIDALPYAKAGTLGEKLEEEFG